MFSYAKKVNICDLSKYSLSNCNKNTNFATIMKKLGTIILALMPFMAHAQRVELQVAGTMVDIPVQQTQSELKPGWKIVDVKLKDKLTHYLWGGHAAQMTDDQMPIFMIEPGKNEVLSDYALIRLQHKKQYRKLPKSNLRDNDYTRVEPTAFDIKSDGKDGFICHRLTALEKGEYILVNISQTPIGDLQDLNVFPFQVP